MKLSQRVLITAAFLLSTSTTNAFSTQSKTFLATSSSRLTPLYLSSTAISSQTEAAVNELPADYAAIYEKSVEKLRGKLPPALEANLVHFVTEYFLACSQNSESTPESTAHSIMMAIKLGTKFGMGENKFTFGNTHVAIEADDEGNPEPGIDFYDFGVDLFKQAMNLEKSVVLGGENAKRAFERIKAGDNVVFLANHQSEADPQVFSVMLEQIGLENEAKEVIYVAGHKVTTDALAIPFSMGRNLICIHSKKHIDAEPELKESKQKQNLSSMSAMLGLMRQGGKALWVAPSGGRDRRNVETGDVPIADFDQKTIDMFRLMGNKSKVETHFFPLAMVSYNLCPPPDFLEAGVGEKRNVRYTAVGIAVGNEVPNVGGVESRHLFTEHAFEECQEDYEKLLKAIDEKSGN